MYLRKTTVVRLGVSLLALIVLLGAAVATELYLTSSHAASVNWKVAKSVQREKLNFLSGVAARTANDVWAVGSSGPNFSSLHTLIEHWDGSKWSVVKSPNVSTATISISELSAVAAVSSTNAWAVGLSFVNSISVPLIEHWNGKQWSIVALPLTNEESWLSGISARTANDIWAVGATRVGGGARHALVEHWNGTAWSSFIDPTPDIDLNAVTALASNNVWAVGNVSAGSSSPIAFHWDGQRWQFVPTDAKAGQASSLVAITALSAGNIWAVGAQQGTSAGIVRPLIEHWNGKIWSIVSNPTFSVPRARTSGLTAFSPNDIWAVGDTTNGQTEKVLIEHWNGSKWSIASNPVSASGCSLSTASQAMGVAWAVGSCQKTSTTVDALIIERP